MYIKIYGEKATCDAMLKSSTFVLVVFQLVLRAPVNSLPTGYVDYRPSTGLKVILSAPHGGTRAPALIPSRNAGCWEGSQCVWTHACRQKDNNRCSTTTVSDLHTDELTLELHSALCERFGACPAAVINLLDRAKLDPNREMNEATFNVSLAMDVYNEYHGYIRQEREAMCGPGLYIDIHGHGRPIQRVELGYLVYGSVLNSGNSVDPSATSIRGLYSRVGGNFDDLLRSGVNTSFGGLLESHGYAAVPSPSNPGPGRHSYFSGGYSTRVHGSRNGGFMDGIQIESPRSFRVLPARSRYVAALADTIESFLTVHNYHGIVFSHFRNKQIAS